MSRIEKARQEIEKVYQDNDLQVVVDVMDIIKKYTSMEGKGLMEFAVDELQQDSLKLCAYNFTLGTLASNYESDWQKAVNVRKFKEAEMFCAEKEADPKKSVAHLEAIAQRNGFPYRAQEGEAQRRAMIIRQAVSSVQEMVNMLKKVVERLMWQGNSTNL